MDCTDRNLAETRNRECRSSNTWNAAFSGLTERVEDMEDVHYMLEMISTAN